MGSRASCASTLASGFPSSRGGAGEAAAEHHTGLSSRVVAAQRVAAGGHQCKKPAGGRAPGLPKGGARPGEGKQQVSAGRKPTQEADNMQPFR